MKNKRKWKRIYYVSMICILISGMMLYTTSDMQVHAEEKGDEETEDNTEADTPKQENDEETETSDDESSKNSGGFTIHSEKVEGDMDMAGALEGNIAIEEGTIEGLTITKELDTGNERDPMIIQITSPGPVKVKNLQTETMDGGAPDFGGICGLDPICMEDVTMVVDYQDVESLSLPDASITTCFEDECADMQASGSNKDTLDDTMALMEEQLSSLKEIMDGVESDKEMLKETKGLLKEADDFHKQIEKEEQVEALENVVDQMKEILDEDTDDSNDEEAEESVVEQLESLVEEVEKKQDTLNQTTTDFSEKVDTIVTNMDNLEKSIKMKEEALGKIEKEKSENDKIAKQEEKDAIIEQASGDADNDDEDNKIQVKDVNKALQGLKDDFEESRKKVDKLAEQKSSLQEKKDNIFKALSELEKSVKDKLNETSEDNVDDNNNEETESDNDEEGDEAALEGVLTTLRSILED